MKWNPYINALGATVYVWGMALLIRYLSTMHHDTPDTWVTSVAAMSMMIFSAAVMAFFFFYRPVSLLVENKRKEALNFFLKTLGTFGLLALVAVVIIL
jgi:hypothetical protein